ncbi:MAG: alpha/beta hydrolase [Anaerolineaceae bacterium]|nr:alpha/beta hydrolase [Anaerolineaceae bacterium]
MAMTAEKFVSLSDGRKLAYVEYGNPDGKPLLYFHGHPGSRLDLSMFDETVLEGSGLRLLSIDRPGIGLSDFQPGRKLMDWPADVCEFGDALDLGKFSVMGMSGGGPFAAACAYAIPERLHAAAIISGLGRFDLPCATENMGSGLQYFKMAAGFPLLARLQMAMMAYGIKSSPEKMLAQIQSELPEVDKREFKKPGFAKTFMATTAESLRQGADKLVLEGGFYLRPWGFPLEGIRLPVYLWHGEADRDAPLAMGRHAAAAIPGCKATFLPGEGHFSLAIHHMGEILHTLS